MKIKPTRTAINLSEMSDDLYMDALLFQQNDDVPCPWDAEMEIKGDQVIISGGLSSGGSRGATCVCTCSIQDFDKYYYIYLPDSYEEEVTNSGWVKI